MTRYNIIVNYDTGDSFNQYPGQVCTLVQLWTNLDIAKENLVRIEAHNRAYKKIHGWGNYGKSRWEDYKNEDWYSGEWNVKLKMDNGELYDEHCDWVGYFENFNFAEIVPDDTGMKIYPKIE